MPLRPSGGLGLISGEIPLGTYATLGGEVELLGDWVPSEDPNTVADDMLRLAGYFQNTTRPLIFAKELAVGSIERRFITETDPDGTPWVDWTEPYQQWREQRGPETKLVLEGRLLEAATDENAWIIENDTLFFDPSGLPIYAGVHQSGGGNKVPARPFLGFDEEYIADVGFVFDTWFSTAVEGFTNPRTGVTQAWVFTPGGKRLFGPKV